MNERHQTSNLLNLRQRPGNNRDAMPRPIVRRAQPVSVTLRQKIEAKRGIQIGKEIFWRSTASRQLSSKFAVRKKPGAKLDELSPPAGDPRGNCRLPLRKLR